MSDGPLEMLRDFVDGPVGAHILGACPVCGAALTIHKVTSTTFTDPPTDEAYEAILCSEDPLHTIRPEID